MPHSLLHHFVSIRPRYEYPQAQCLEWFAQFYHQLQGLTKAHNGSQSEEDLRRLRLFLRRFGCSPDRIAYRGSDLSDFQSLDFNQGELYTQAHIGVPLGLKRTLLFEQFTRAHFKSLYADSPTPPAHLMHVTCTGYTAPSPAQYWINAQGWNETTEVSHMYHMGCYASLPSVRLAQAMAQSKPQTRVDVVHTELCSLHLGWDEISPEQAVIQSLFGDGMIRYSVTQDSEKSDLGFEILKIQERIIPHTVDLMTWKVGDSGMQMTLSREIPQIIKHSIGAFLKELLSSVDIPIPSLLFAIHPGGPRIIDDIQELLQLDSNQVCHSMAVLKQFGNMSSATLPHIWKSLLEDATVPIGQHVLSIAFGPGLTIFGSLMRKVK